MNITTPKNTKTFNIIDFMFTFSIGKHLSNESIFPTFFQVPMFQTSFWFPILLRLHLLPLFFLFFIVFSLVFTVNGNSADRITFGIELKKSTKWKFPFETEPNRTEPIRFHSIESNRTVMLNRIVWAFYLSIQFVTVLIVILLIMMWIEL